MRLFSFLSGFILGLLGLIFLCVIIVYSSSPKYYNVLFVGSDQRDTERARSDVLFLVSLPKNKNQQPLFLTIPRDTLIEHKDFGLQKITHFYALGEPPNDGKTLGNINLSQKIVEKLLGIEIDATIEVTFGSFEKIIDDLGGVTLKDQATSGDGALKIIRDRFTSGRSDFDRQADAREVLRSLMTKIKTPSAVKKLLVFFENDSQARLQYDKVKLLRFLFGAGINRKGQISIGEMQEEVVPGRADRVYTASFGKSLYYWIPDQPALQKLLNGYFYNL